MLIGTITGRITATPELKTTASGTGLAAMTIASDNRRDEDGTTFLRCVAFGKLGQICADNLIKGQTVTASGRLEGRQWIADDGSKRTSFELVADQVEFGAKPKSAGGGGERSVRQVRQSF